MAVLIEGYSIVIRKKRLERKFKGGLENFEKHLPNNTYCHDDNFIRVGFMRHDDLIRFSAYLEKNGLKYIIDDDDEAFDFAIALQSNGFFVKCNWAEIVPLPVSEDDPRTVMACRLAGSSDDKLVVPEGWKYEESFYNNGMFLNVDQIKANLKFVKREGNVEIYEHRETGKIYYIGRSIL